VFERFVGGDDTYLFVVVGANTVFCLEDSLPAKCTVTNVKSSLLNSSTILCQAASLYKTSSSRRHSVTASHLSGCCHGPTAVPTSHHTPLLVSGNARWQCTAGQRRIHAGGQVAVHPVLPPAQNLHQGRERGRPSALQPRLLAACAIFKFAKYSKSMVCWRKFRSLNQSCSKNGYFEPAVTCSRQQ
jgi:hypothetical protein